MPFYRIILTTLLLSTIAIKFSAQETQGLTFEGELHFRTMENHDENAVKFSFGMSYNGARDIKYIIKGNKVLYKDESTNMYTILDPDKDSIILFSTYIKKGMKFNYSHYIGSYLSAFSADGQCTKELGYINLPSCYRFNIIDDNYKYKDYTAQYIEGRIENQSAGTSIDIINMPNIKIPRAMYHIQLYGISIDGLIAKLTYEQINNVPHVGELKTYVSSELKEMISRNVDDSEFNIPSEISIDISESPFEVVELYKQNDKYLKKNKLYPTQINKNVIYEINEEWDF